MPAYYTPIAFPGKPGQDYERISGRGRTPYPSIESVISPNEQVLAREERDTVKLRIREVVFALAQIEQEFR
jgi:hypothetical protein